MLSTIAACGTIKKEIGLRRDLEAFLYNSKSEKPTTIATKGRNASCTGIIEYCIQVQRYA